MARTNFSGIIDTARKREFINENFDDSEAQERTYTKLKNNYFFMIDYIINISVCWTVKI